MLSSTISDSLDVWDLKGTHGKSFVLNRHKMFLMNIFRTDLGHQTAQRIVQASDPLQSMLDINQNFPSVVSSLSRMKVFL